MKGKNIVNMVGGSPVVQRSLPFADTPPPVSHRVVSLGGGVQSTVLALLSAKTDVLPTADAAVFADTGSEHPHTYEHLDWLGEEIGEFPILKVGSGRRLADDLLDGVNEQGHGRERYGRPYYSIPIYAGDGRFAGRRTCTAQYKIRPLHRAIRRQVLGLAPGRHVPDGTVVEQWLGISLDESHRMKPARGSGWLRTEWPLITMVGWTREACVDWFDSNYPHRTLRRSACTFCPYQTGRQWAELREVGGRVWEEAVAIDDRLKLPDGTEGYLHPARRPLAEAVTVTGGQVDGWGNECEGVCGV